VSGPHRFDFDALFDADYLYFYASRLSREHSLGEADRIARLTGIEAGTDVLDCPCGHGRIAIPLAQRGARVTGLDASRVFLDRARADGDGVPVTWVLGDMRALPFADAAFDVAFSWFAAFGYFGDDDNRRVLVEAYRVLRPGGRFLLEMPHRDWILRNFQETVTFERGDDRMVDRNHYDAVTGCMVNERSLTRDGVTRELAFFVRQFTGPELRDWLFQAGFSKVELLGADDGPLTLDSRRLIAVATR
jgi:SAM-dependent methyltransferase